MHGFLTLNDCEVLEHAGKISNEQAEEFTFKEFEKYQKQLNALQTDELDQAVKNLLNKKEEITMAFLWYKINRLPER